MEHHRTKRPARSGIVAMVFAIALSLPIVQSCYFDNAEELLICSPSDVSYSEEVAPLLETRCYECHDITNGPALGDGIILEGYGRLLSFLEDNEAKLLGSLKWNGEGTPMPDNGTKLDNCSISKIETWINEGKRNN